MATSDDIGTRGEAIFFILLTQFCGRKRPFFRPQFLGDKFPTLDYIVELVDAGQSVPFFFVQVKTTTKGYTKKTSDKRLKIQVSQADIRRLLMYPAPTYVVGIDEREEIGFIISVNEKTSGRISSLSTKFPLNCTNLELLWNEVKDFWNQRDMVLKNSIFSE